MILYFDPLALPRTLTKHEWKVADRQRRIDERRLAQARGEQIRALAATPAEFLDEVLDRLICPPMLISDHHMWEACAVPSALDRG